MRIVLFFYKILLVVLAPVVLLVIFIIAKKKNDTKYFSERMGFIKTKRKSYTRSVWLHASSVGEVKSIKNLADGIRKKYPDVSIIVSTFTTTGRSEAINFIKADEAFLLPIENAIAIRHHLKLFKVKAFFIIDTEIWPNLISVASEAAPLFMINARISDRTFKSYRRFSFFFKYILQMFAVILTKSDYDSKKFVELLGDGKKILTIGDIKFQARKKAADIEPLKEFKNINYFLAASTHEGEEEIVLNAFKSVEDSFDKLLIAPRHVKRADEIKTLALSKGFSASLLSENMLGSKIIIIDAFGLLEPLYIGAKKIFIGGSIAGKGGHNIYEALQFAKNAAVGPNMYNFKNITDKALKYNLIKIVDNEEEMVTWLKDGGSYDSFDIFFKEIDEENGNAVQTIMEILEGVLR